MIKSKIIIIFLAVLILPYFVYAQTENEPSDEFFVAEVIEVIKEQESVLADGKKAKQQNLLLKGLEEPFLGQEFSHIGIDEIDVISKNIYDKGDKVLVVASYDDKGESRFYITDYVRTNSMLYLLFVFVACLLIVGRTKGLRALISLALTFLVIIKYIIPQILAGTSPFLTTLFGSIIILLVIIYITEGFKARSHLAVLSIFICLFITIVISTLFVSLTKLTGVASEEISFLFYIGEQAINFKGLLLAGIIIGTLGVLDDVVISQIATVEQIAKANPAFGMRELFKRGQKVGVSHIASMSNTLFLAYAGVSLPLLLLFVSGESAFSSWGQIINNEAIATEIVRTLSGSIGLILAVPIATIISAKFYSN
ncbi:MAG: YibE/F family protein [Patescibacteria group bacterium]|nr:YibE/F family protein [Patescibacteria group bacterium]